MNTIKNATNISQTPPKVDDLLKDHEEKIKMMSGHKKDEIGSQEDELQRRLRERRDKSFAKSFNLGTRHGKSASFSISKYDHAQGTDNL